MQGRENLEARSLEAADVCEHMYQLVDGDDLIGEDITFAGSALFGSTDHALCNIAHVNEVICAEGERYGELALEEHSDHLADGRDLEVIGAAASAGIADNCLKLVVVILKHIVCGGSLSLCIGAVKNLGIEVRNLTHNLIIGERGVSVNGGSVDKAFYAALFARLNDVLCAVDIDLPGHVLVALVYLDNACKVIDDVRTFKSLFKRSGIGDIAEYALAIDAVKNLAVFSDEYSEVFAACLEFFNECIADVTRSARDD